MARPKLPLVSKEDLFIVANKEENILTQSTYSLLV